MFPECRGHVTCQVDIRELAGVILELLGGTMAAGLVAWGLAA